MEDKEISDHVRAIGVAAVSAIPIIGGPLATLIQEYVPATMQKRQATILKTLSDELKRLESRINDEKFRSEAFNLTFIKTAKLMLVEQNEEKLEAFKAIILNDAITSEENFEKEFFVAITNSLTGNHIRVLKILENPEKFVNNDSELSKRFENIYMGGLGSLLELPMRPLVRGHLEAILDDLHQKGLCSIGRNGYAITTTKSGILQKKTTDIGERYIKFITAP